jgi:hypothetical protein
MTETDATTIDIRRALADTLRAARATERTVFDALDPAERDSPSPVGGWSPKDVQAHLGSWRGHMADRLTAIRKGRREPEDGGETDVRNAVIYAERMDWPWDQVRSDAEATADDIIAAVEAADDATLWDERTIRSIMGNGAEHTIIHAGSVAAWFGTAQTVAELVVRVQEVIDRGGWPPRAEAFTRYNLACFHALAGRLDEARALLRLALPAVQELRGFAPDDPDLIALRDEIPALSEG